MLLPLSAQAQQTEWGGQIETAYAHNENALFEEDGASRLRELRLTPSLSVARTGRRGSIELAGGSDILRSFDDSVRNDRVDYFADLGANYQFTSRTALSLGADFRQQSLLTGQLDETGIISANDFQRNYALSLSLSHDFDSRNNITVAGNGVRRDTNSPVLQDITQGGFNVTYTRRVNSRLALTADAAVTRLDPDGDVIPRTDSFQGAFGVGWQPSRTLDVQVSAGPFFVSNMGNTDVGFFADGEVSYTPGPWTVGVRAGNSLIPTSLGAISRQRDGELSVSRDLGQAWSVSNSSRYVETVNDSGLLLVGDTEVFSNQTRLTWDIGRSWQLAAQYSFTRRSGEALPTASNHFGTIVVQYRFGRERT